MAFKFLEVIANGVATAFRVYPPNGSTSFQIFEQTPDDRTVTQSLLSRQITPALALRQAPTPARVRSVTAFRTTRRITLDAPPRTQLFGQKGS